MTQNRKPCRYVPDWGHYLPTHEATCRDTTCEGCQPCTHDEAGNPVRHCTARKNCGGHLSTSHPATCPKCIAKVRANITWISRNARLLTAAAIESGGVDTEAANLAGPAADPFAWTIRRVRQLQAGVPAMSIDPEDPHHPLAVLGRWEVMLREHYHQPPTRTARAGSPRWTDIMAAAGYLFGRLTAAAQDPDVDWAEMATELYVCRSHMEDILNTARRPETGAPCPSCPEPVTDDDPKPPALKRVYAHWCDRENCEKEHDTTGASDLWRCPRCDAEWKEAVYRKWVSDDFLQNSDALTATEMQMTYDIKPSTLRTWAQREEVRKHGKNASGQQLYNVRDTLKMQAAASTKTATA